MPPATPTAAEATLLLDTRAALAEGPVYDARTGHLYYVDIVPGTLHAYHPDTGQARHWTFGEMLGVAVPCADGRLLLGLEGGLAFFDPETQDLARTAALVDADVDMRINDGKVDARGRLWVGTMHKRTAPDTGALYCVDANLTPRRWVSPTTISNGIGWSPDGRTLYYVDSAQCQVCRFAFDPERGTLGERVAAFTFPQDFGLADGLCVDAEGMLYVAHWGGACVRRWDPHTGEVLGQVAVDAPHVSSCAFGGPDGRTLFITTARVDLSPAERKRWPGSGGVWQYRAPVPGLPTHLFAGA